MAPTDSLLSPEQLGQFVLPALTSKQAFWLEEYTYYSILHLDVNCTNLGYPEDASIIELTWWKVGIKDASGSLPCDICIPSSFDTTDIADLGEMYTLLYRSLYKSLKDQQLGDSINLSTLNIKELCSAAEALQTLYIARGRKKYDSFTSSADLHLQEEGVRECKRLLYTLALYDQSWQTPRVREVLESFAKEQEMLLKGTIVGFKEDPDEYYMHNSPPSPSDFAVEELEEVLDLPDTYTSFIIPISEVDFADNFFASEGNYDYSYLGWAVVQSYGTIFNNLICGTTSALLRNAAGIPAKYWVQDRAYTENTWSVVAALMKDGMSAEDAAATAYSLNH